MLIKQWSIKARGDEKIIKTLSEELKVDDVVANLLVQRNVSNFDEAKSFFRPDIKSLHNPFLMKDMDKAVERLEHAFTTNEKILVYGDYDVDGTTSVALMYSFILKHHKNVDYYIPERYGEGYGVSFKGIDYAAEKGIRLIIALDCGIKAIDRVEYANNKGIDFIICDHHNPGEEIPKAFAVLDPKRTDCNYPYKELSGCGVGFKLVQAFCSKNNISFDEIIEYLDLLAVSISSDIVPIVDENRILTYFGLKELNNNPRIGLKEIIKIAGLLDKEITVDDIVFKIGPRINAAGRIESGKKSVDLLVSKNIEEAQEIANKINDINTTRRDIDSLTTEEALHLIGSNKKLIKRKSTVIYNSEWHKGVIGIVASRLMETYYRPTVVLTEANGLATGSARSVYGYDLYKAIDACSDLLENFGGHMYAAGLTLKIENIPAFSKRFEEFVNNTISQESLVPVIEIDADVSLEKIDFKLMRILKQFEPFGPGNMTPIFITENVFDNGNSSLVGSKKEHLKLSIVSEKNPYASYNGIAFGRSDFYNKISEGKPFDICYSLHENVFNGKTKLQLRVRDIKLD